MISLLSIFYTVYFLLLLVKAIEPGRNRPTNYAQGLNIFLLICFFLEACFCINSLFINRRVRSANQVLALKRLNNKPKLDPKKK